MKENWFDIIKRIIEDDTVIWKAPPPYTHGDNRYLMAQFADITGLDELLSAKNNPLVNIKRKEGSRDLFDRNAEIRIYPVLDMHANTNAEKKVFAWKPQVKSKGTMMMINILDDNGAPISKWDVGAMTTPAGGESPRAMRQTASGNKTYPLEEDEIGIKIIYSEQNKEQQIKYRVLIDGYVGMNGDYWQKLVGEPTADSTVTDYDLTNGEAAMLLVLTQIIPYGPRGKPKKHQERQELIEELGLGKWDRRVGRDNKYVDGLVSKGLLEIRRHSSKGLNKLPVPTAKGKAVSNSLEMKHDYFDNEFTREVKMHPDEPFVSLPDAPSPFQFNQSAFGSGDFTQ